VVDGLARLGHDSVVSGHDDDGDIRDLGATRAHCREGLVARRIEERDQVAVDVDLVRADVLGDAACLAGRDASIANDVQQARLAMIDVAHDGDDRRSWLQERRIFDLILRWDGRYGTVGGRGSRGRGRGSWCRSGCSAALLTDFEAKVGSDHRGRVVVQGLVDGRNRAVREQGFDDLGDGHAKSARQVGDADDRGELDRASFGGTGRGRGRGFSATFEGFELSAPPAAGLAWAICGTRSLHWSWHTLWLLLLPWR